MQLAQSTSARYRCTNCSAPVTWDPAKQAMACDYCGGTQTVEVGDAEIVEHAIEKALTAPGHTGLDRPVRRIKCGNCHAVISFDPGVVAGKCAFCGAAAVTEIEGQSGVFTPESLLPFTVDRDTALQAYRKWLAGLWFRPNDLKKRAQLQELAGVYLPFWTFDAHAESWWTADAGYYYYVTETYRDSQGRRQTRQVRRTRWERASGRHRGDYDDVLVYASRGLPEDLCRAIEPFHTRELRPWDGRYLAGFGAEEYAIDAVEGWRRGQQRMQERETRACAALVPGDTYRNLRVRTEFSNATFKHVLLPVWIAAYLYKDKSYRFLVNGQTGEVQGKAPWSWIKITLAVLAAIALVLLLYALSEQ